jgi:hypothetical protein
VRGFLQESEEDGEDEEDKARARSGCAPVVSWAPAASGAMAGEKKTTHVAGKKKNGDWGIGALRRFAPGSSRFWDIEKLGQQNRICWICAR